MPTLPDEDSIEADWAAVRPQRHCPPPSHEPHQPVTPDHLGDAEEFVQRLQILAEAVISPRNKLQAVRSDIIFLAIEAGANPSAITDDLWSDGANEYRMFADAIGFVPRMDPSTPLGLQLVDILRDVRRGNRALVSERLLGIAQLLGPTRRVGRP